MDYPEAIEASGLLEEFLQIVAPSDGIEGTEGDACAVFFDKAYLTMAEFLAPIGEVLVRQSHRPEATISGFLSSSIKPAKTREKSSRDKLHELLSSEMAAQAEALEHLKRIESIQSYLGRVGR